ncbi:MAG: acylphosphatase [Candidatus Levybacteria bacterium]|nr:acylphosphatase [Candidatus Levybacteria bacterium]
MKQAHVFISGNVQGVGYRQFVKHTARKLDLTGWVRNTEDGGVEAVLQGEESMIEVMIEQCKKGPFMAEVAHCGFEWEEGESLAEFKIL